MTWAAMTRREDGTMFADHTPSKGATESVRVFYDKDTADHNARRSRRHGRRARVFSRTVRADGTELALFVVVTRNKVET